MGMLIGGFITVGLSPKLYCRLYICGYIEKPFKYHVEVCFCPYSQCFNTT